MTQANTLSRRSVLKAGAGLTLALMGGSLITACAKKDPFTFKANAFLNIGNDGKVTVICRYAEMGQGSFTGIATLVAEELDADWAQVQVEGAPGDAATYGNPAFGPGTQATGGSNSLSTAWDDMRRAGAAARAMLVQAAASAWKVPAAEITVEKGVLKHAGTGKDAPFADFVEAAAALEAPKADTLVLKDPKDYSLIGTDLPRVDVRAKSTGTAVYTQDFKLPGMLTALVIAAPRFGGKVKSFDAAAAKAMPGVKDVVAFKTLVREGVAVLATDYWSARQAREKVVVEWDDSAAYTGSTEQMFAQYRELARKPGTEAVRRGTPAARGARTLEAAYEFPYLAHAAMEPLNYVAQVTDQGCEMWGGAQFHTMDQNMVAAVLGIKAEQVRINTLFSGGSFGRRSNPKGDFAMEAAVIAKAAQGVPVKLVWSREDDMRGGFYRPAFFHTLKAAVDAQGNIVSWQHRLVGQSILGGTPLMPPLPIDPLSTEGAANLPYDIPNFAVDVHTTQSPVTVQWWRSVGSTHTAYSTEVFLDEIARATGQDPLALRQKLLPKHPRHQAVLKLAAEKAGWGTALPEGVARGIAVHECFGSVVAEVAEVRKVAEGQYKVERIVAAAHVGRAVNPNIVAMQIESSIGLGLGAAFTGAITLKDGMVEQSNFHDYTVLRLNQMPKVEVHIVPSEDKPSGIGEPGLPPAAAAVANAIAALGGPVLRTQPFSRADLTFV
ncbi:MAG: hypothetical protein RL026_1644 [Pseudomonadota bacterium]|jgi:isoquinoline 1-oxidoreductase beta subunit